MYQLFCFVLISNINLVALELLNRDKGFIVVFINFKESTFAGHKHLNIAVL